MAGTAGGSPVLASAGAGATRALLLVGVLSGSNRRGGWGDMPDEKNTVVIASAEQFWQVKTRRDFLRVLGIGGTAVLLPSVFAACDDDDPTGNGGGQTATLNLGSEVGILNYAFALEQLEAGFYEAVVASAAYNGMTAEQKEVFTDLRNHEVAHREFFRQVIPSGSRIGNLAFNTTTLNASLANTASILKTAETFEDLGVAAYNGAGKYLTAGNLLLAGKIVSVEARHAAAIRDMREGLGLAGTPAGTRFAGDDVVTTDTGLDVVLQPATVLSKVVASGFVATTVNTSGTLPVKPAGSTAEKAPPSPTP